MSAIDSKFSKLSLQDFLTAPEEEVVEVEEEVTPPIFRTREKIGEGGYGQVFKINNEQAEKVMSFTYEGFDNYSDINNQNLREAVFYAFYPKNENLLSSEKVEFDDDNNIRIVIPLYEMNLFRYIQKIHTEKQPDIDSLVSDFYSIFSQVCTGLSGLYSNHLFHGDIKPSNIAINSDTKKVALIDFSGIKYECNKSTQSNCTRFYIAPELCDGYYKHIHYTKRFGPHNDVWSLGMTMLEFLTNENRNQEFSSLNDIYCFINRTNKSYPVERILKDNHINPDDEKIKPIFHLISRMLVRDVHLRISFDEVHSFFYREKKETIQSQQVHQFPIFTPLQSEERIRSINRQKAIFEQFSEYQCAFELGVSICDRYVYYTKEEYTEKLLDVCMYIAVCLLTDITDRDVISDFFCLNDYNDTMTLVISVIKTLNFDLYRPTFFQYISGKGFSMNKIHRKIVFSISSNPENAGFVSHDDLYDVFVDMLEYHERTPQYSNVNTQQVPRNEIITTVLKRKRC